MPPGYVTSHCTHTSVGSDDLCPDSLFLDSRRDTQPGSSSDSAKDGSDDGEETVCIEREQRGD